MCFLDTFFIQKVSRPSFERAVHGGLVQIPECIKSFLYARFFCFKHKNKHPSVLDDDGSDD